jgi:BlaI family transcriptional regulator, penicillinase repressor
MDVVYRRGRATAVDVARDIPDPPSYTAVRTMLRILEAKGHLRHERQGTRYVYQPVRARAQVSRSTLHHVVRTFFEGSAARAMATLIDLAPEALSDEDLERLTRLIDAARKRKGLQRRSR